MTRFLRQAAASCVFAAGVFALLALSRVVHTPLPRYDLLLAGCLLLTAGLWAAGVETGREVAVVGLFHLVGIALELFKVRAGSWSYPEPAYSKVGGVPLYAGFMYAAVGSFLCQAWRRFDLVLHDHRPVATPLAAAAAYANFFTHHWLPDLRVPAALALLATTRRTQLSYRVGGPRRRVALPVTFVIGGAGLWLAENAATFLGAWRYPDQADVWHVVHVSRAGSWALLVSVSFVLVAALKRLHWRCRGDEPSDFGTPAPVRASIDSTSPVDRRTRPQVVGSDTWT